MTSIARRQEPDPAQKDIYAAKYDRYKKVVAALDPIWKNLN
jgi:sugar (pentulose or hexulose) kinase